MIHNSHPALKLPVSLKSIRALVSRVFKSEKSVLNKLEINLVSDSKLQRINNKYLGHNYSTDIITFPYDSDKRNVDGELLISLDIVKKNSIIYNTLFSKELKRVIIHGCLHLAGYNDSTSKGKELIRRKENFYLGD